MERISEITVFQEAIEGYLPAIASLIFFSVFLYLNNLLDFRSKRLFGFCTLLIFLLILDTTYGYFVGKLYPDQYILRRYLAFFNYAFSPIIFVCFLFIGKNYNKKKMWLLRIPLYINVILAFGSIYGGYMFYVTEDNVYGNGPLFFFPLLTTFFYLVFMIYDFKKKKGLIPNYEIAFLVCCLSIEIIMTLIEEFFKVKFIIYSSMVYLLILYYILTTVKLLVYDKVTGCYARSLYDNEVRKLNCRKREFYLVMIDMNGLKQINDTYGHKMGDEALRMVANSLFTHFENKEKVYRVGGDEFVILAKSEFLAHLERKLSKAHLSCGKINDTVITFAYGIAKYDGSKPYDEIMVEADDAMYKMKDIMHKSKICL